MVIALPVARVQTTAVAVQLAAPARAVHGSDGREHVEYDLVITNTFASPVKLDSVLIRGAGRRLLSVTGKKLAAHTFALSGSKPTATIPVSATVKTVIGVVLPRSFGRTWPKRLTNHIRYTLPSNVPARALIGSTLVPGPVVPGQP